MNLLVLGSSGTAPVPGNPGSGYLLSSGGTRVLLDIGPGVAAALMAEMDPADLDAVFISHRHPDHCSDVFALYHHLAYSSRRDRDPIPVFAPEGVAEVAAAFVDARPSDAWHAAFDWRPALGEASAGQVTLRFGRSQHSVPASCVRVDGSGGSLTYSGDTGPKGEVAVLASGSTTVLCEATYQESTDDGYPYHLSASQAGAVAAAAGAQKLVLTHLRSSLDPAVSVSEAKKMFDGPVLVAEPGMRVDT